MPSRGATVGLILIVIGISALVAEPCISMALEFQWIASRATPGPEDLRGGIIRSLLWGLLGVLIILGGILVLARSSRRSPQR